MNAPWSVEELAERQAFLLHNETGVVGRAKRLYPANEYKGENGRLVELPVLELDTGDTFVVRPEAFTPLSDREVALVEGATKMLTSVITVCMRQSKAARIELPVAALLVLSCFRMQERALELESRRVAAQEKKEQGDGG
jgi:hypothetical protein